MNGDANLSGTVDADDYFQIDSYINKSGSSFGFSNGGLQTTTEKSTAMTMPSSMLSAFHCTKRPFCHRLTGLR